MGQVEIRAGAVHPSFLLPSASLVHLQAPAAFFFFFSV